LCQQQEAIGRFLGRGEWKKKKRKENDDRLHRLSEGKTIRGVWGVWKEAAQRKLMN
jgi:hypothetical protein